MTIINGIEIDNINYEINDVKLSLINNTPLDNILHIIIVISNPCQYAKRYILARQFIKKFENELNIKLYIVELAYDNQAFYCTDSNNKNHLQLKTSTAPLWHKENMINIGVNKLLPNDWKAFAWIDADIEFENNNWALDALKILNGSKDVIQLFSHALDLDNNENIMNVFSSFGFQYCKKKKYSLLDNFNYWHPGFAWAITRNAYKKIGGLYEYSILGSGDHNMALCFINKGLYSINDKADNSYKQSIINFQNNCKNLRLGYIPGVIRHFYHGKKINRKYTERWKILINCNYNPFLFIKKNNDNLLIPSELCPVELLNDIFNYFKERNEDE